MSTQEVSPRPMSGIAGTANELRDLYRKPYRLELPDGTFLTARTKKELMDQMRDVRDNVN